MKKILWIGLASVLASSQASAWGLGDIGGQLLKKGAETAVTNTVSKPQTPPAEAGAADPNSAGNIATQAAAGVASDAAADAMAKSGVPGGAVAGKRAGGLVKGIGGMFKKKAPADATAPSSPDTTGVSSEGAALAPAAP